VLSDMELALRSSGHRLTPARRAVVQVLAEPAGYEHFVPEEVLARARRLHPRLGRATVYRTLEIMASLGFLRVLCDSLGKRYYVRATGGHHHLLCRGCNAVVPLATCPAEGLEEELAKRFGYTLEGHVLEFYGLCPACQAAAVKEACL